MQLQEEKKGCVNIFSKKGKMIQESSKKGGKKWTQSIEKTNDY